MILILLQDVKVKIKQKTIQLNVYFNENFIECFNEDVGSGNLFIFVKNRIKSTSYMLSINKASIYNDIVINGMYCIIILDVNYFREIKDKNIILKEGD